MFAHIIWFYSVHHILTNFYILDCHYPHLFALSQQKKNIAGPVVSGQVHVAQTGIKHLDTREPIVSRARNSVMKQVLKFLQLFVCLGTVIQVILTY